jgi:hypothetical protein
VPWITTVVAYNAVLAKVERLDLGGVLDEVGQILTGFDLMTEESISGYSSCPATD